MTAVAHVRSTEAQERRHVRRYLRQARSRSLIIDFEEVERGMFRLHFIDNEPWVMTAREVLIYCKGLRVGFAIGRFGPASPPVAPEVPSVANNKRPLCTGSGEPPIAITKASEAEPWIAGGTIGRHARGLCPTCDRDLGLTANDLLMPHVPPR